MLRNNNNLPISFAVIIWIRTCKRYIITLKTFGGVCVFNLVFCVLQTAAFSFVLFYFCHGFVGCSTNKECFVFFGNFRLLFYHFFLSALLNSYSFLFITNFDSYLNTKVFKKELYFQNYDVFLALSFSYLN